MSLTAEVSSSLLFANGSYFQQGNMPVPVVVKVYNSGIEAVQLRQLYLTQDKDALGTGAGLSLGEPIFKYIASTPNTTNNIIPAGGTGSYDALFVPQVDALTTYPSSSYTFGLTAVIQRFGYADTTRATPATFTILEDTNKVYSLVNNYQVWSLYDNKRPPQNADFDYQLYVNETLQNGETLLVPQNELYFSSSNPSVASVIENTPDELATTGSNSQLSASGGSVIVSGSGNTDFFVRRYTNIGPVIASGSLSVVDALPVRLEITLPIENFFFSNAPITPPAQRLLSFRATLVKSNNERVDISNNNIWSVSNTSVLQNLRFITGRWQDFQINPNSPVNEFGYTTLQITAKYQGFVATAFMNAIIRTA